MDLIPALQKDDALLADIRAADASEDLFHTWWLGQSGFLVAWNGHHLLFDPYLSDSLTRKYADTDKPHLRMSEPCLDPRRLDFVKVLTSSHNHTDHLDGETLDAIAAAAGGIQLVLPDANIAFARERLADAPVEFVGLDSGGTTTLGPWELHGIPAAHNTVERDDQGRCRFLGFVVKFGPFAVYHSGDTLWHDGLVEALRPFAIDLALLPINGNKPERRVAGNLNGTEAAALAKAVGTRLVVPCHYHMFTFNTEDPDEFARTCERLGQNYAVLRGGEKVTLQLDR